MSGVQTRKSEGREPDAGGIVVRRMGLEDVDEVAILERHIFPAPWPGQAFIHELNEVRASYSLVARKGDVLVGYLVAWFLYDEAHVGNVAVRPELRRLGTATRLIKEMLAEAERRSVKRITLEVRVSNLAAIRLYRRFGFKAISIRRGYYVDNREDAFVMLRERPATGRDAPPEEDLE